MNSSSEKLSSTAAQRLFANLAAAVVKQIDIAVKSPLARDRRRARSRLARALAAVTDRTK